MKVSLTISANWHHIVGGPAYGDGIALCHEHGYAAGHKASDGILCIIANLTTVTGRIQCNLSSALNAARAEFAVAAGPVSADHPFLTPHIKGNIDKLSEASSKIWSVALASSWGAAIAGCEDFSTNPATEIGATTNVKIINLSLYSASAAYRCGFGLTKQ